DHFVLLQEAGDVGDRQLRLDLIVEDGDVDLAALIAARVVELLGADLYTALHTGAKVGGGASQGTVGANVDCRPARTLRGELGAGDGPTTSGRGRASYGCSRWGGDRRGRWLGRCRCRRGRRAARREHQSKPAQ